MGHHRRRFDRRKAILFSLLSWRKNRRWKVSGKGELLFSMFKEYTGLSDPYRYLKLSKAYASGSLFDSKWKRCSRCLVLKRRADFTAKKPSGKPDSWCKRCNSEKAAKNNARIYADPVLASIDRARRRKLLMSPQQVARRRANYERKKAMGVHLDHKYRRKARMSGGITATDARLFRESCGATVVCNWCGERIAKLKAHVDHIVPLYRGGAHALYNLCWSCRFCNESKGAKMPNQWIQRGQLVLEMR